MPNIFKIKKDERWGALIAFLFFTIFNAISVAYTWEKLSPDNGDHWGKFIKGYHLSGFDPITYAVISDWQIGYNIYRHPLLPYFMWPFSQLNAALTSLTGADCATIITACLLVACAVYACVFTFRIIHEIIGTDTAMAWILTVLTFSFAFIMLPLMAPDHFGPSMLCLLITLYISGRWRDKAFTWWQTILLFVITAGISLNNGMKIFMAALMTRGKRFFHPAFLIGAVLIPAGLMWYSARCSYSHFVLPKELARKTKTAEKRRAQLERLQQKAVINITDTARITAVKDSVKRKFEADKAKRRQNIPAIKKAGKPLMQGEFMGWTDITTSRWDVLTESLLGEGIMIHEKYLLGDVLRSRPVIVRYRNWFNYFIEGALAILFIAGIWYGRRQRFMWTALSFLALDMALHMGLGFGINEIFIMSAHYLYVLPITMAYLFTGSHWQALSSRTRRFATWGMAALAAYLIIWNVSLITQYFLF